MPTTPEANNSEKQRHPLTIGQFSLEELNANPFLYESLLKTYCDIFSGPPWNEEWWTPELVEETLARQLSFPGVVTLATEDENAIGFSWASEGKTNNIVPFAVNEYFETVIGKEKTMEISSEILRKLSEGQNPENLYWWCEMGIKAEKRGGTTAMRILKAAINAQLAKPDPAKLMFGMTDMNSVLYKMVSTRGGQTIFQMSEVIKDDPRVFMICDIENLT